MGQKGIWNWPTRDGLKRNVPAEIMPFYFLSPRLCAMPLGAHLSLSPLWKILKCFDVVDSTDEFLLTVRNSISTVVLENRCFLSAVSRVEKDSKASSGALSQTKIFLYSKLNKFFQSFYFLSFLSLLDRLHVPLFLSLRSRVFQRYF